MARRRQPEESLLFDLPLDAAAARRPAAPADEVPPREQPPLPLTEKAPPRPAEPVEEAARVIPDSHHDPSASGHPPRRGPDHAHLGSRLAAGVIDLGVCVSMLVFLLVALRVQGVRPSLADWPAGLVFLLAWSFLYTVLPLAFWGRTPGMTLAGIRAVCGDGRPMTFRQATLKWLGLAFTTALVALPLVPALWGRSLSDLLSGTVTRRQRPPG